MFGIVEKTSKTPNIKTPNINKTGKRLWLFFPCYLRSSGKIQIGIFVSGVWAQFRCVRPQLRLVLLLSPRFPFLDAQFGALSHAGFVCSNVMLSLLSSEYNVYF